MRVHTRVLPGSYFENDQARRDVRWAGRGLAFELGTRAYRMLVVEDRIKQSGWGWPPGLELLEELAARRES